MKKYGIVAIGYNRKDSLVRLLQALNQADYKDYNPLLIVSLDFADMPEIEQEANSFQWEHGEKIVKAYKEKQGLRKHILSCGNYLEEYDLDAIAVFEDDVFPSPAYFNYMIQAVNYYENNDKVAGISLYTHLWNVNIEKPFVPLPEEYDTFFIQFAQSWGQVWLRKQWKEFIEWYQNNQDPFYKAEGVPANVSVWKDSSWLKYHIKYCIDKDKYFVYPYESLCTNYTDVGTHNAVPTTLYQVPLQINTKKQYCFPEYNKTLAIYDAFFENQTIAEILGISQEELCVDLYGSKEDWREKKYWLTMRQAHFKIKETFGLQIKPHELNVIVKTKGTDIKLYDLTESKKNRVKSVSKYAILDYYFKLSHCRGSELLGLLIQKVFCKIK